MSLPSRPDPDAARFDPIWYIETYPDVPAAGIDPWEHYCRIGRSEGRQPGPIEALRLDRLLWQGEEDIARPRLERLLQEGPPAERAVAGWVLARWYRDRGDPAAALTAIDRFHAVPDAWRILGHPAPFLLAVDLCLQAGRHGAAAAVLEAGLAAFGPRPDFDLAALSCARAAGAPEAALSAHLARLHAPSGLAPVRLRPGPGALFDRLTAGPAPAAAADPADAPLVSVIVPVFNARDTLGQALDGLAAQDWPALEILVVDDGSTDGSAALAAERAARDPRIRLIAQAQNRGAYPARNAGLAAAEGAFVTVHDADDWSHPSKIRLQAETLMDDAAAMASVSHWVRAGADLDMTHWRPDQGWVHRNVSSLMIRADLRDRLGYWDRVRVNADTEYYYRIIAAFGPQAIAETCPGIPLAFGRTAPDTLSQRRATHLRTQFNGVRRDYMAAAHHWHGEAGGPDDLHLPQHPPVRPFRVPQALSIGDPEGPPSPYDVLAASPLFDGRWYLRNYPDILEAGLDPVRHYLKSGGPEDRDPGPGFSSGAYRLAQDLPAGIVPLLHFETAGRAAGADPRPGFDGTLAVAGDTPRVLLVAHQSGRTLFGAERSFLDMAARLVRQGQAPVVVLPTLRNRDYLERLRPLACRIEVVPQLWRHVDRAPNPDTVAVLRRLIRTHAPAAVHVNTLALDAPLVAARAEGVETVVHIRELPEGDPTLCRALGTDAETLRRTLLAEADRFVANSALVAAWLDCPGRIAVRPNMVDAALFDLPFEPGKVLRFALISSNVIKKGIDEFLAVARLVDAAGEPARFVLIGPPTRDLHLLRPWPDNVEFADYAETPEQALRQADVVMSLSHFSESFGRTVLEALAAGRPVICYDRGAPPTLVESGRSGLVVPPGDRRAAANAALALCVARQGLARMSDAARQRGRLLQDQALAP